MEYIDEIDKDYSVEKEKLEKMKRFTGAEGGRLDLPDIGEQLAFTISGEPYKVNETTLRQRGYEDEQIRDILAKLPKGEAWFMRVRKEGLEYDMPLAKTIWMQIRKEMLKHGFTDLIGRTFVVLGKHWKDAPAEYRAGGKEVKTYVVTYRGVGAGTGAGEIKEVRL